MRRCAGASSPTIRQRSIASRERGTGKVRAVQCWLLVDPPVPGLPLAARANNGNIDIRAQRDCCRNFAAFDEHEAIAALAQSKPLGRSRRNLCRIPVCPAIAPRHNTTTGMSFGRLCTSPEISGVCDHKRQTSSVKPPKTACCKETGSASYACKTTRNPPPAHLTGNILLGAGDQRIGRTQIRSVVNAVIICAWRAPFFSPLSVPLPYPLPRS